MTFVKYQVKDNSFGQLLAGISAVTTSIVLKTGNGANLPDITSPDNPSVLTLVQVDGTGAIVKSEQVLCTNRASDTLTVTRGFAGTTAQAFDADDYIYLYQTATVTQDMQNEIERLEDEKLDTSTFNSTLRNNLGDWNIIYTNASGDETELPLGSSGQYLRSTGVNTAPEFATPPLDINGQTTDNGALAVNDYLVYYDTSEGTNNKRLAKGSKTHEGMFEMLEDSEVIAGTDEARVPNAKQLHDYFRYSAVAGTTYTCISDLAEESTTNTSPTKLKDFNIVKAGQYRIKYEHKENINNISQTYIYKNGSLVYTSTPGPTATYSVVTYDITLAAGDNIQLYASASSGNTVFIKDAYVQYDVTDNRNTYITSYFTGTVIA